MRRIFFLLFVFLLTACSFVPGGQPGLTATSASTATATLIIPTLTASLAPSATPLATETLAPLTVTPLPTIPTFTPTFDARTIVTATPAPKAECPKEDPSVKMDFLIPVEFNEENIVSPELITDEKTLAYLNKGGSLSSLVAKLQASAMAARYRFQDVTGDGMKDLLVEQSPPNMAYSGYVDIETYSCADGTP